MSGTDAGGDADAGSDTGAAADTDAAEAGDTAGSEFASGGGFGRDRPPRSDGRLDSERRQGSPYTESQVIMPTVKIVAPFAFTYGLFVTFHGAGSPGGGFQGGAIVAAVVFMIAFAFGIEATRQWLANTVVVALAVGGALVFAGIGLVPVALGGAFLQYELLPIPDPVKYGMEGVEILGIGTIVAGVLIGLFLVLAKGFSDAGGFADADAFDDEVGEGPGTEEGDESTDDGATEPGTPGPAATDGGER
ncbi:monovalent cation/H+ antiporter subunit B [Halorubrum distributum JCM 9100]|uniref:Monovalent cation/H+ antiporter subunit B n=3 Tax=Halorubrum distributum TaxID=29283 RepID=M0EKP0_9EURY|nr:MULTISPECIES: MnhB domain-containing protein [Halorubrum distributum group]PHQ47263.1 cation:proton antiporter [Halorubrum sp. C3]ELZ27911.1 monovalent cation/H+ antiporter subunit B [Halorubrum terrestre JCM 10247]ELZ47648.1 monovalent cation/H+ antiporter subunit B [Halorubrum distributum JCM 9100]ELZ52787.1 monovalent cation/H+ antiporter subunit B [Halorubrum distributum JCM 10118]MDV7348391.1 MnhB domain-containing protein [Halorubrum distributum]